MSVIGSSMTPTLQSHFYSVSAWTDTTWSNLYRFVAILFEHGILYIRGAKPYLLIWLQDGDKLYQGGQMSITPPPPPQNEPENMFVINGHWIVYSLWYTSLSLSSLIHDIVKVLVLSIVQNTWLLSWLTRATEHNRSTSMEMLRQYIIMSMSTSVGCSKSD